MTAPLRVAFAGGTIGAWRVERISAVRGDTLPLVARVAVLEGSAGAPGGAAWVLRGVTSHERYVTRAEHDALAEASPPLGRTEATRAALIPVRKSAVWWALAQDERRALFEERSRHVGTGLAYLPAVAGPFEELVVRLRESAEWAYVEREVDIRLER